MVISPNKMQNLGPQLPLTAQAPNLDYKALRRICSMGETAIAKKYGLTHVHTADGGYWFKDNKSDILAVAHLDSQMPFTHFAVARMRHDTKIFCPTLDDRLGAYLLLEYLPKAGVQYDILLTTNEEKGRSTARFFRTNKQYHWMFMFDRMGTGAVVYNYGDRFDKGEERGWSLALEDAGLPTMHGMYSCIKDLEFLGCKGVNVGVGYYNNHDIEAFASKNGLMRQIQHFLAFYEENAEIYYPHIYYPPNVKYVYPQQQSQNKVDQTRALAKRNNDSKAKEVKEDKKKESQGDAKPAALAVLNKQETTSSWKAKRAVLQQDITFLNVSPELAEKLKQVGVFYIGELARKSRTEILNLDHLRQSDLEEILRALALIDLSTCTRLSDYGLICQQGMIGEVVSIYPPDTYRVEEPDKKVTFPVSVTTTKESSKASIIQLDGKSISFTPPPLGTGTIEYSIPLLKGDDAQLFRNAKGEVVWTHPLPKELVGFKASRDKSLQKQV